MTYSFGKGQFWPLMLLIGIHMMAIAIGCLISRVRHIGQELNAQLVLYSCLFGLANIYCPNWISYQNSNEDKKGTHSYTILREFFIQMAFILENLVMLSIVIYSAIGNKNSVIYGQTDLMYLAIIATVTHLVGVGLRVIYYKKYHIWKNILWKDFKNTGKKALGFEPFLPKELARARVVYTYYAADTDEINILENEVIEIMQEGEISITFVTLQCFASITSK